jgi:uncharacterized protein
MYIKRHIKKTIDEYSSEFSAVLLTGPRQIGKSTVLVNSYPEIPYQTLDDMFVFQQMHEDSNGYIKSLGNPVIFDEIQRATNSFLDFKYLIDKNKKPGMYILTCSQKFELMKGISESLAGRVGILNMLGLSNREIYKDEFSKPFIPTTEYFNDRSPKFTLDNVELWKRIHKGSMPELYSNKNINWERYFSSYIQTYIDRDINELAQVGNKLAFLQFLTMLASRTGELLNLASLANDVGIDQRTAKSWLSILEATNMIILLQPFSFNVTKRVVKTPKVYFTDTGLVCYLCRWLTPDTAERGAMAGALYETFVINEIIKSYYNSGKDLDMYFYRDSNGSEVDLLFYQNGTIYPIEIKKTSSPNIKDIKHFKTLNTAFNNIKTGEGGVICNYEKLAFLSENNKVIPISYI